MSDMNQIAVTGHLTRDSVIKNINSKQLLTFGIANNIGFGQYESTNFYTVNMWGDRGLKLAQYLKKGTHVGVVGQEKMNEWVGNDGVSHADRVITAHDITFLGGQKQGNADTGPAFSSNDDRFGGDEAPVF